MDFECLTFQDLHVLHFTCPMNKENISDVH